jgi:hypothetical protein
MAFFSLLVLLMCRPGRGRPLPFCGSRTGVTRWALLALGILLVPSPGRAENLQQTIGLLPDAESECYYVQALVKEARATAQGAERSHQDSEAAEAAGDLRLASNKMTIASIVLTATTESWATVSAALQAMESQHGVLPACAVPLKDEWSRERQEALEKTDHYKQRVASLTERLRRS